MGSVSDELIICTDDGSEGIKGVVNYIICCIYFNKKL